MKNLLLFLLLIPMNLEAKIHPFLSVSVGRASQTDELYTSFVPAAEVGIEASRLGTSISILDITQKNKVFTLQQGELNIRPIMWNVYLLVPMSQRNRLRFGAGVNYTFASHSLDGDITKAVGQRNNTIEDKIKSGQGYQAFGGYEHFITRHVSFGVNATYLFFGTTVKTVVINKNYLTSPTSVWDRPINLDELIVMATMKYRF